MSMHREYAFYSEMINGEESKLIKDNELLFLPPTFDYLKRGWLCLKAHLLKKN